MSTAYKVPEAFIEQRNERQGKYKLFGRTPYHQLMDIDAELYEYDLINECGYEDDDRWQVDFVHEGVTHDAKCIDKWYNISQRKLCSLLRQRKITDKFTFWEWQVRPDRPLEAGDHVVMNHLITKPYWDVMDKLQPSGYPKANPSGYYIDIRKMLK